MKPVITKAVIPAAGLGTRFLPQTKAIPKEMLPLVDKPIIHYVVEEVVASGIENIILISGYHKRVIEDYFDHAKELENHLQGKGKEKELAFVRKIPQLANFINIRQRGSKYGNAIPVLSAKPAIEDEFFAVVWGDELIRAQPPRLAQMLKVFEKYRGAVISAVEIEPREQVSRYGIADVEKVEGDIFRIKEIVEKPAPEKAPSNLATHGAYILPPAIFKIIENLAPGKGGEYWLTEAINKLIKDGFPVYACKIQNAKYYDTGNKLEYLKAVIDFALQHPEVGKDFKEHLKGLGL